MRYFITLGVISLALAGCARNSEDDLRARLGDWFRLGETIYFKSERDCTAASFRLTNIEPFPIFKVQRGLEGAIDAFTSEAVAAIRIPQHSPHEIADAMLLKGDGRFGKEALRAAARSVDCLKGSLTEGYMRVALTRQGGLLAYDRETEGLIVLDPVHERLFYVGGNIR